MSADSDNMLARLQIQLAQQAQPNQPSLFGLQAQQDPNVTAQLLKRLQDQNYVNQQGNEGGEYGFLANAGKKAAARFGQNIGNMLGVGAPPQYDNSATMAQRQAIMGGKQDLSDQLAQGVDPNDAQVAVLRKLAQAGVPGAAESLSKAQDDKNKQDTARAQAFKDTQQGNEAQARTTDIPQEAARKAAADQRDALKNNWQTISEANGYIVQKNGLGEIQTKKNSDAGSSALAQVTPDAMASMLDYYKTNGQPPPGIARSPAVAGKFWDAVAADSAQTGDYASAVAANKAGLHANTQALAQTQKQLSATQSYLDTMDKNIDKARTYGNQIDLSDSTALNKALAAWDKGTSNPTYAKYNLFFDAVANESAKIKSGSLGNVAVSDSMRHETADILNKNIGNGGLNAVFDALKDEGQNRVDALSAQRDALVGRISKRPGAPATQTPAGPPAAAAPTAPSSPLSLDDYLKAQGH